MKIRILISLLALLGAALVALAGPLDPPRMPRFLVNPSIFTNQALQQQRQAAQLAAQAAAIAQRQTLFNQTPFLDHQFQEPLALPYPLFTYTPPLPPVIDFEQLRDLSSLTPTLFDDDIHRSLFGIRDDSSDDLDAWLRSMLGSDFPGVTPKPFDLESLGLQLDDPSGAGDDWSRMLQSIIGGTFPDLTPKLPSAAPRRFQWDSTEATGGLWQSLLQPTRRLKPASLPDSYWRGLLY